MIFQKVNTLLLCITLVFSLTPFTVAALDQKAESGFNKGINEAGGTNAGDLLSLIKNVINTLLFVAGIAAVIIMIVSGFRYVTSDGDSNAANKAKNTIIYASIGLVVSVMSYAIVNFILDQLG